MKWTNKLMVTVCCLILACSVSANADGKYIINDSPITDMSIEELYILEDAVRNAINDVFAATSKVNESGDIIGTFVINTNNGKFHYPYCQYAIQIGPNRRFEYCTAAELFNQGLIPCGNCNPYVDKPEK